MGHYILRPVRKPGHHATCSHDKEGGEPASGHYTRTGVWTRSSSGDHRRCLGEEAQGEHAPRDHTEAGRPRKTKKFPKKALRTWMRQVEPRIIILIRRIW